MKWTKMDHSNPPSPDIEVLAINVNGYMRVGWIRVWPCNNKTVCWDWSYDENPLYDITHYIPVSELPKIEP